MRPSLRVALLLPCTTLLFLACADGAGRPDAARPDRDGSSPLVDGGRDAGRDAGGTTCPAGQHRCGGGCIVDLGNEPANGCRYGCGEPCPTPPDGDAACDSDGVCTIACPPPFHREGDTCVCAPRTCDTLGFACGAPDDGCGTPLDCGACDGEGVCTDGRCNCPPDAREPNDSRLAAPRLASLTDAPDSEASFDAFTIHTSADEDWFSFDVADDFDAGNPAIGVTLDRIPADSDYDLAAYYVCTSGGDASTCTAGTADNAIGRGCASASTRTSESVGLATECSGTDEGGRLYVRISAPTFGGSCAPYRLVVTVN